MNISTSLHILVNNMDRYADNFLKEKYNISYSRFYMLAILESIGTCTQHDLAQSMIV